MEKIFGNLIKFLIFLRCYLNFLNIYSEQPSNDNETVKKNNKRICSNKLQNYTINNEKIALSSFNDKYHFVQSGKKDIKYEKVSVVQILEIIHKLMMTLKH